MNKALAAALPAVLALALTTSACSQFTTNDAESAELQSAANAAADDYLVCIKREALLFVDSNTDPEFIVDAVRSRCTAALDSYRVTQEAYLETEVILTSKPLDESVANLQQRARTLVAEEAVRVGSAPLAAAAVTAAVAAPPAARTNAPVSAKPGEWSSSQRIYLDCMLDQARRYATLQESAEVVAEVAANGCSTYLTTENAAALMQEGRGLVLKTVLEAKLNPQRR
jgi:hypothetical protein